MKKLILLGGVPGTGKTTIAYDLALRLHIDKVISTDLLKIFAKTYNQNFNKYIFTSTHEAYKLENISVVEGYLRHSKEINNLVLNVLQNINDNIIIIEGATINKEFINSLDKNLYEVVYINLTLPKNELVKRYKLKEKLRKSNWINNILMIEQIAIYLEKDNFNIINNNKDETIERVVNYVKENLHL